MINVKILGSDNYNLAPLAVALHQIVTTASQSRYKVCPK